MEAEPAAAEQVNGAGRVEECGQLGEPVAATLGDERGELGASVGPEGARAQRIVPSSARSRRLSDPPGAP